MGDPPREASPGARARSCLPVDVDQVRQRLGAAGVDEGVRHIGPVAQDFYAAFGTGTDDKHLAALDSAGVALAAIQGLNENVERGSQRVDVRIQRLEAENAALKDRLAQLEGLVHRLATQANGGAQ